VSSTPLRSLVLNLTTINSEKTHNGFLNTRNSAIIFLGSGDAIFPKQDIQSLIQDLNTALLSSNLTPLQRAQFKIQLKWLKDGSVPGAEIIVQSNGLINPANNTNYLSMISGLMVIYYPLRCARTAYFVLASTQQGNNRQQFIDALHPSS
jgi:hypothetical protein